MHHVMYCFIEAYFQNRTMILESSDWRYDSRGFEAYFLPLSETCSKNSYSDAVNWNGIRFIKTKRAFFHKLFLFRQYKTRKF